MKDLVDATGRFYSVDECIELESLMRDQSDSEWGTDSLLYIIGMSVADRHPDEFLQEAITTWLDDPSSTAFADDLIKQSIIREIGRGQKRGWQAIERIAARSAAEPTRKDIRYLILHRALVEIGGLDAEQNLERTVKLWIPDSHYSTDDLRARILSEAQRITQAKQTGQPDGHGDGE